jgi:SAM-dependent methyltransferase
MENPFERQDRKFRQFQEKNPGAGFAQWYMSLAVQLIQDDKQFKASSALAVAHQNPAEFWGAAEKKAAKWFRTMSLKRKDKVVEYGCGSLRLGAHFIRFLDPGCYLGLDVVDGFFEFGEKAMGQDLFAAKAPKLLVIDEPGIETAARFDADIVFSNLVCLHVHPDELDAFFSNLLRLTSKPGARLIFNAVVSDKEYRFGVNLWARPIETIKSALKDLKLVRTESWPPKLHDGVALTTMEFEFRR